MGAGGACALLQKQHGNMVKQQRCEWTEAARERGAAAAVTGL